jgi:hypothetical protein
MNPNENVEQYREICGFLNSPKDKFLEERRKEEEMKAKKNKKLNMKIL